MSYGQVCWCNYYQVHVALLYSSIAALHIFNYILYFIISETKVCPTLCTRYEKRMEKINSLASFSQALKHAILKAKAYFALKYNNLYT